MDLNTLSIALRGVAAYRPLMDTPVMTAAVQLLLALRRGAGEEALDRYTEL